MIWFAIAFNIAMFLWLIYETLLASGAFGPTPASFPLGPNFGIHAALFLWAVGDVLLLLAFLIRRWLRG